MASSYIVLEHFEARQRLDINIRTRMLIAAHFITPPPMHISYAHSADMPFSFYFSPELNITGNIGQRALHGSAARCA